MDKEKNCLLLVPSLMTRDTLITYTAKEKDRIYSYEGHQTNEAVAKYLMESLRDKGECLSNMIMLCSTEVERSVLEVAGGRTTYEYLKNELGVFYKEVYSEDMPSDFFVPIEYKNQAEEDVENIMTELKKVLGRQGEKENLYVDFTGGIRSAAMALVFICRILKAQNVETKKVLYSNISGGVGSIEDITGTYNLFLLIEGQYNAEKEREYLGTLGVDSGEIEVLLGSREQIELAETNNNAEAYKNSLRQEQKQIERIKKSTNSTRIHVALDTVQGNQPRVSGKENSDLLLLKKYLQNKKSYDKALNYFRQTYVSKILPKENIITVKSELKEGDLSDEVLAAYRYYENYNYKKGEMQSCFLWEMREYVQRLGNPANQKKSPKDIADRKFNDRFYNLEAQNEKKWIKSFGVNDMASWDIVWEDIKPYINKQFENTGSVDECLALYKRLFRLYTIAGYPFECVFKNKVFAGYAELYEGIRKRGIDLLEALYERKSSEELDDLFVALEIRPCSYRDLISVLNKAGNEWMLTKIFPFSFRPGYIGLGSALTQDWGTFSYQLAKSFSLANRVRNQQTHEGSEVKNPEMCQAVEEVEKFVRILTH